MLLATRYLYNKTMNNIINSTRLYDFQGYYKLYRLGIESPFIASTYYFFARYGIVFFFLSFIYLIWKRKIPAFLSALISMGFAGVVDFLVYIFWQRPRPFIVHSDLIADPIIRGMKLGSASFPSSHTYVAFAIATSMILYGHRKLGSALFVLAVFIALGRIGTGLHYPSDVIAGAILGTVSGLIVYFLTRRLGMERD